MLIGVACIEGVTECASTLARAIRPVDRDRRTGLFRPCDRLWRTLILGVRFQFVSDQVRDRFSPGEVVTRVPSVEPGSLTGHVDCDLTDRLRESRDRRASRYCSQHGIDAWYIIVGGANWLTCASNAGLSTESGPSPHCNQTTT